MNVTIVGLGYVGLTLAGHCLKNGHRVSGVEINPKILKALNLGKAHFHEPGLDEIISNNLGKQLKLTDNAIEITQTDVIIITVGTPLTKGSKEPDLNYISSAITAISHLISKNTLIILRSTVTVGLTREKILPLISDLTKIESHSIKIAFCPERTVEGDALQELYNLPQIVSGNNIDAVSMAANFFSKMTSEVIKVESLEAAELVKLFNNVYRDINFSIGNLFNDVARNYNLNGLDLISIANHNYKRSNISKPGLVGGPCLEKDSYILCSNIENKELSDIILGARRYNENLEDKIVRYIEKQNVNRVILCGMAFKGKPETGDLRGSNSVNIAYKLSNTIKELFLFDPIALNTELEDLQIGQVISDIYMFNLKRTDLIVILNNNQFFETHEFSNFISISQVLDLWDITNLENKNTLGNY